MGLFDRFKKKDNFDFSSEAPPDFSGDSSYGAKSGAPGQGGANQSGLSNDDLYGRDPLQHQDPFAGTSNYGGQGESPPPLPGTSGGAGSAFSHDVFSSSEPTNAENARSYAQGLGGQPVAQGSSSYAGAVTGHELQLILERLDTIKAELDAIKQRMYRVEQYLDRAENKNVKRYI